MAAAAASSGPPKIIDSHLHVWASPQQVCISLILNSQLNPNVNFFYFSFFYFFQFPLFVFDVKAAEKYPYFPGQEPTLPGQVEFLLEVCA